MKHGQSDEAASGVWVWVMFEYEDVFCDEVVVAQLCGFGEAGGAAREAEEGVGVAALFFIVEAKPVLFPVSEESAP